jgi:nucleotide-binding universal stress UspA family protein
MTRTSIASRTHLPHDPLRPAGPILVALGGSDVSGVLRAARYFASGSTTGMLAVSILEPLPTYSSAEGAFVLAPDLDAMRAENLLATLNAQILEGDAPVTSCQTEVIAGEPSHAIVEAAHTHHSPLIVMGIGRHKPLDRVLGLETAVRTVRRASCSVLAVHANIHVPFRDVVLATDFSPASVKAAETVIPLLTSGSVIHLVHVWEPSAVHDARLRTLDESYVASLPTKFRRLLEILKLPSGIAVKEEVLEGRIAERVLHYADTHDADVIVAGRQGLNALARLMVGSVTESLLRGAKCSVLIAPAPTFAELDGFRRLITGTSASKDPAEWAVQLDAFTARNRGRRAAVEVDDLSLGAQVLETGYPFQGVTYDPHDKRVELMLGDAKGSTRHLSHGIGNIETVAIATDDHGLDTGLLLKHGSGQTILTLSPD